MSFMRKTTLSTCLIAGLVASATTMAAEGFRVDAEPSRTVPTKATGTWRAGDFTASTASRLRYGEMSAQRILEVEHANDARIGKPLQIGIAREAATESAARALPALQWQRLADGSAVARIEFTSPLAYGVRAGLKVEGLDPRAELRFAGSARPGVVVATLRGDQVLKLAGENGLYWTPMTEGEKQHVEIWLPASASRTALRLAAPQLSHLLTNATDDFKILEKIGESGACNIDTVCRVSQLGQNYLNAKAAVARMTFVKNGGSYLCTGTLLNDTDTYTQIPYFHTANHCISTQAVASTLNTFWDYESTTCNADVLGNYTQLSGGADYLYSSASTDGALLRLNDAAPASSTFSGWDSNALTPSTAVTAIHHPSGDVKKVSFGQHIPASSDAVNHGVGWLEGTTEGGSSGSGLFTINSTSYYLRGGLYGGNASCANTGSLSNTQNRDWYSRFDVDFPNIRQYLMPEQAAPIRRNGSQPLATP